MEKNPEGVNQFDVLFELSRAYYFQDVNTGLTYATKANELAFELGDSLRIVKSLRIKAQLLRRLDRINEAVEIFNQAFFIAKRNQANNEFLVEYRNILNGLAIAYTFLAEYDKALDLHFQSLVLREREGNKGEISISLNNIGLVYFKLRNYEKALEYYNRSLNLKRESKDVYDLDRLLINIGLCHVHLKHYNEAKEYIKEGLNTCKDDCSSQILIEGKFGLGVASFNLNSYSQALENFKESFELAIKTEDQRFQAENLVYLGKIAILQKQYDDASNYLIKAEDIARSIGYNQLLIDTYKQFSFLYNAQKDFERASDYQNRYIDLKDSLIGEELVKNVSKIQSNFEERENLATIKLKEDALARQRNLNISIGIITVLSVLLIVVLYKSNRSVKKVNAALSDAKAIIETQNAKLHAINRDLDNRVKEKTAELQKANQSLSRVNEELDNFIYKTSHDIRGPLASLKGICTVALLDVKDTLALDYFTKLDHSADKLNVILTRLLIVNQINHASINVEAIDLNELVDEVILLETKKGLPRNLTIKKDIITPNHFQSDRDLVRIVLENLIDNAIKFYNDSDRVEPFVLIKVNVDYASKNPVSIHVIDNGIGIAEVKPDKIFQMFSRASERSGTGGIGLYLSKLATEKLGGTINLGVTAEGYTEFSVSFPVGTRA